MKNGFKSARLMTAAGALLGAALWTAMAVQAGATPPGTGYTLAFADEFNNSTVNQNDWYYRITGLYTAGYNRSQNVTETGGMLRIRYGYEDVTGDGTPDFTGGGVISRHLFGYGYYETSARLFVATSGLHSSFWSMGIRGGNAGIGNDPLIAQDITNDVFPEINQLYEIDGFEHNSPNNMDQGTVGQSSNATGVRHGVGGITYGAWNTYGYDYEPDKTRFYVNNVLVFTIDNTQTPYVFNPMNMWLTALPYSANSNPGALPGYSDFDYFRYYRTSLPGANRLGNASFDAQAPSTPLTVPGGWIESYDQDSSALVTDDVYDGTRSLKQSGTVPYVVSTKQNLTYLPNGLYTLTAWVKSSGGQTQAAMRVLNYGGTERVVNIGAASVWTQIAITGVNVTNGQATIAFSSQAAAGQWLRVDKVAFQQQ